MDYYLRIILSATICCSLVFLSGCDPLVTIPAEDLPLNQFQQDMLDGVNKLRAEGCQCGKDPMPPVEPIGYNQSLNMAAERHARDMARSISLDHNGSDGSTPATRIEEAGYEYAIALENIAFGHRDIQSVMTAWLESEGHCKNIMNPQIREMGAAKTELYWVQTFASPQD